MVTKLEKFEEQYSSIDSDYNRYSSQLTVLKREYFRREFLKKNSDLYRPLIELKDEPFLNDQFRESSYKLGRGVKEVLIELINFRLRSSQSYGNANHIENSIALVEKISSSETMQKDSCFQELTKKPAGFVGQSPKLFRKIRLLSTIASKISKVFCEKGNYFKDKIIDADQTFTVFVTCLGGGIDRIQEMRGKAKICMRQVCRP